MTSQLFTKTLNEHYKKELPFVVYSMPSVLKVKALLQKSEEVYCAENYKESGFVFAPFHIEEKTIIIPNDKSHLIETEDLVFVSRGGKERKIGIQSNTEKGSYLSLVEKTINKIKEGVYKKVVISRKETVSLKEKNVIKLFLRLLKTYEKAFVYCFYHPKIGTWLGATPETFMCIEGNRFKTMSLAGTRKISDNKTWNKKEKKEQQLVTNFIVNNLNELTKDVKVSEIETTKAGDLLHLKTTLSGIINFDEISLKTLCDKLHPTPAVCGLPKEDSRTFVLKNEGYNREYYTGFLGELNYKHVKSRNTNTRNVENNAFSSIKNTSNLFVNLRCMQVKDHQAIIYVGGGITIDSVAEKEWEETVNKSQTMKKILY